MAVTRPKVEWWLSVTDAAVLLREAWRRGMREEVGCATVAIATLASVHLPRGHVALATSALAVAAAYARGDATDADLGAARATTQTIRFRTSSTRGGATEATEAAWHAVGAVRDGTGLGEVVYRTSDAAASAMRCVFPYDTATSAFALDAALRREAHRRMVAAIKRTYRRTR